MENVPAGGGDLGDVGGGVHRREEDEAGLGGEAFAPAQVRVAGVGVVEAFAGELPSGDGGPEAARLEPAQAVQRLGPAAGTALGLVHRRAMMVEADPHRQPLAGKRQQRRLEAPHRPHRVGQDQRLEAPLQRRGDHCGSVAVHERLAAGEADLAGAERRRLVQIGQDLRQSRIDERVVGRGALDIAALAGEVAERPGVDPQRVEPRQGDPGAGLALRGDQRVSELGRVERPRCGIEEGRGGEGVHRPEG